MIFGHQFVQVAGLIAVILDFAVFKGLLGLPYLRLPIIVAAIVYFLAFYLRTSDFYSASTAKQLDKRCPGTIRRYKSNVVYFIESLLAIVVLLIPITILLFTMLFNQRELLHVSFFTQCIIAVVGYLFLHLISLIYEIGPTHSIGYSATAQYSAKVAAARKQRETEIYNEAKFVVDQTLFNILGVDQKDITPTASLENHLGAEILDIFDILSAYDAYLGKIYHVSGVPTEPPYGMVSGERMKRYDALRLLNQQNQHHVTVRNSENYIKRFMEIFPLVQDHYEFLGGLIRYYRYYNK